MGACWFQTVGRGASAKEAFSKAVEEAKYEHGNRGYSGTIAEKDSFKLFTASPEFISEVKNGFDIQKSSYGKQVDDKWGPAGAFHLEDDEYLFFGWASE